MKFTVKRPTYKRAPLLGGGEGFRTVPDGHLEAEVDVVVDWVKLANLLGARAMKSKSGKSVLASGIIKCKVVSDIRHEGGDR